MCVIELYTQRTHYLLQQLAALLLMRQIVGNIKESCVPYFMEQMRLAKLSFDLFGALSPTQVCVPTCSTKQGNTAIAITITITKIPLPSYYYHCHYQVTVTKLSLPSYHYQVTITIAITKLPLASCHYRVTNTKLPLPSYQFLNTITRRYQPAGLVVVTPAPASRIRPHQLPLLLHRWVRVWRRFLTD